MAGNMTVFVELSLDDRVYKQKLSETLTSTQTTAKGAETAWKALGVKSDAVFESQARAAQNAYTLIKNSATSTADDIIRAEEAKNAKLTALNEQQFGKQTSLIDGLKSHWIAATVAISAAYMLAGQAWAKADAAAQYIEQMQLLDGMVRRSGQTAQSVTQQIRDAGDGMISMATAASSAMSGIAKGLSPEQMINLAKASVTLSDVMGKTANEAFRDLSTAMETGKQKSLKLAVGVLDLKSRYGEAADKMTEAETRQALYNIVIEKAASMQARMGDQTKSTADKMDTYKTTVADLNLMLGVGLIRASAGAIGSMQTLAASTLTVYAAYQNIKSALLWFDAKTGGSAARTSAQAMAQSEAAAAEAKAAEGASAELIGKAEKNLALLTASTADLTAATRMQGAAVDEVTGKSGAQLAAEKEAARIKEQAIKSITEAIRKAAYEAETIGQTQYEKDIARIDSEAAKYTAAMGGKKISAKDFLLVAEYVAVEMEAADKKAYEAMAKAARAASDTAISEMEREIAQGEKLTNAHIAGAEKYRKLVADEYEFSATENERQINAIIAKEKEKLHEVQDLYEKGYISFKEAETLKKSIHKNTAAAILEKETENALKISKLNYDLIKDVRGWEKESYAAKIKEIDATAAKEIKDGADYEKVMAKKKNDTELAYIAMGKSGDDFFAGVNAGYLEMQQNATTFGKAGYEIFKTFSTESKKAVSDILFDSIKTGTFDAQKVWTTFTDTMLRKFTDTVSDMAVDFAINMGKMVTEAAANDIIMWFKGTWTQDSSAILGILNKGWDLWNSLTGGGAADVSGAGDVPDLGEGIGGLPLNVASGGLIPGYASGGDSKANDKVPAWLSPGEYVVPRSAVNADSLELLEYLRKNGRVPGYAAGGTITGNVWPYPDSDNPPAQNNSGRAAILYQDWVDAIVNNTGRNPDYGITPSQRNAGINYFNSLEFLAAYHALAYNGGNSGLNEELQVSETPYNFNPIQLFGEQEGDYYVEYFRDGSIKRSLYDDSPNFFEQYFPALVKAIGIAAAAYVSGGIGGGALYAALGAGSMSLLQSYAATGDLTTAGLLSAAMAAALSYVGYSSIQAGSNAAEITSDMAGNAAYNQAISQGLGEEMAQVAYQQIYDQTLQEYMFEQLWNSTVSKVKKLAISEGLKYVANSINGGEGGSANYSFAGAEGDLSWLSNDMKGIAPKSTPFAFSAYNGLDYIPRDNFRINAHEGEAVLNKKDAQDWRGGSTRAGVTLNVNVHYHGTVIDEKKAAQDIALLVYPQLKKLEAWGH
jgi:hypothetical protein